MIVEDELITNAFRHAFNGNGACRLDISLKALPDGGYELAVTDDGIGFPAGFSLKNSNRLGLQLVEGLSRQVQGILTIGGETGARVSIRVP
jgi:two-component sensor histidine kinase